MSIKYYAGKINCPPYKDVIYRESDNKEYAMWFPRVIMGGKNMGGEWIKICYDDMPYYYLKEITEQEVFTRLL